MKRLRAIKCAVAVVFFMVISSNAWAHTNVLPQAAKDMIDTNPQLIVVDVREVSEYCSLSGHISGALNYPWNSGVFEERYGELPLDGEILVVCASGSRSNQASTFLDSQGYLDIYDMTGGMSGWEWTTISCFDSDSDGLNDDLDNCPTSYNPHQEDADEDGIGDICDNWITETVDAYLFENGFSSLALDSSDSPHISYLFRYATNASGSWLTEQIGAVGPIALDSSDNAHISEVVLPPMWGDPVTLEYLTNASGSWVTEILSYMQLGTGPTSLAIDTLDKVHLIYYHYFDASLYYFTNTSGIWRAESIEDTEGAVDKYSLALDSTNKAHISFSDGGYSDGTLKYTTNASGPWITEAVDIGVNANSIAVDASDKVHISYYDDTSNELKYATNAYGSWAVETVDTGGNSHAMGLDSSDKVHISYYDGVNNDLKYTTNAYGTWVMDTVDSAGDVGNYSSLAVDSTDKVHISYYDATTIELKYTYGVLTDTDSDNIPDFLDNCPDVSSPNQEDTDDDGIGDVCDACTDTDDDGYGNPGFSANTCDEDNCPDKANPDQLDTYPPQKNGIGDACDCESDFLCDGDVDADDVTAFLADFGREPSYRACGSPTWGACDGDFECDGDVDADDVSKFLEDFGREPSFKPCPACVAGAWCVY